MNDDKTSEPSQKTIITLKIEVTTHTLMHADESQHEFLRNELKDWFKKRSNSVTCSGWDADGEGMYELIYGDVVSCRVHGFGTPGFIYFIESEAAFKIGRSNNPEKRLPSIATGCPSPVNLWKTVHVDDMGFAERWFHKRFADQRVNGEWFKISREDVVAAIADFEAVA